MADLYVCGPDLSIGRVVQADEREVWEWRKKEHNGDRSLVCLECYTAPTTRAASRRWCPWCPGGGSGGRRKHFAHSPGMAPVGAHSPETAWHWDVKHRLCRWGQESTRASAEAPTRR